MTAHVERMTINREDVQPLAKPLGPTGLVFDPFFALHDVRDGPEIAARLDVIKAALIEADLLDTLTRILPRDATEREICLIHTPAYFRLVRNDVNFGTGELSTGDTELS